VHFNLNCYSKPPQTTRFGLHVINNEANAKRLRFIRCLATLFLVVLDHEQSITPMETTQAWLLEAKL